MYKQYNLNLAQADRELLEKLFDAIAGDRLETVKTEIGGTVIYNRGFLLNLTPTLIQWDDGIVDAQHIDCFVCGSGKIDGKHRNNCMLMTVYAEMLQREQGEYCEARYQWVRVENRFDIIDTQDGNRRVYSRAVNSKDQSYFRKIEKRIEWMTWEVQRVWTNTGEELDRNHIEKLWVEYDKPSQIPESLLTFDRDDPNIVVVVQESENGSG